LVLFHIPHKPKANDSNPDIPVFFGRGYIRDQVNLWDHFDLMEGHKKYAKKKK